MVDPFETIRHQIHSPSDAVRWACILEATAPKAGNVFPGRPFDDLQYIDFVKAAEVTATAFNDASLPITRRMLMAATATRQATATNVNLGIILLLGPLVAADESLKASEKEPNDWLAALETVLDGFDPTDGQNVYDAIAMASAGGLGNVDSMDVHQPHDQVDLRAAMISAQQRDRIALQYASGFRDFFEHVVPVVRNEIMGQGDLLTGINRAHVQLLAESVDTLIARKCGVDVANDVQSRSKLTCLDSVPEMAELDAYLRSPDHRLNPGTTADLIAAALYVLLRTPNHSFRD
ncbi:ATP:dephospho-CoA triphosphoribosyl transferase [Rubripirellula tenax]|uniref:ATP:dephospho-CoA triphosphoribosyl transferase n=1 Tax=Rubripirellula tenax TaxID=2528015 RepID=A0A5C6EJG3_9BACT|nr:triphosphoribosyl-dephospho-CoA synthase [Rubripirellula tenax]TWU47409.1 ATP:dephospho-CoA triphosphoribosyl transferase [Rubripirellula tenax]